MALAQTVKPDVVLIDLGVQDGAGVKILHQLLTEHVYRDLLLLADKGAIKTGDSCPLAATAADERYPPAVNDFTLALCHECSRLLRSEPDMVHQLFRIWRHDGLEPQTASLPQCRQLKILVLTYPTFPSANPDPWLDRAEQRTWQPLFSQQERLHLAGWNARYRSLIAHLAQLLHGVTGWLAQNWRTTWQLDGPFRRSVQ